VDEPGRPGSLQAEPILHLPLQVAGVLMKIGDLVKNLNSESGMTGVIVGWSDNQGSFLRGRRDPVVQWADGRCSWIMAHRVSVVV